MMMDNEITLIQITYKENDMGDKVKVEKKTDVLCEVESVTRSEFYNAAKLDLQPEVVFVVNRYDYEGQMELDYEGVRHDVIRSFKPNHRHNPTPMDIDRLELVCKRADH